MYTNFLPIKNCINIIILMLLSTIHLSAKDRVEWITIFIHGTIGLNQAICTQTLKTLFFGRITASPYQHKIEQLREDQNLFHNQAISYLSLRHIDETQMRQQDSGASLFAFLYEQVQQYTHPTRTAYYTFGWSGLLSSEKRYAEARVLYEQIIQELETYTHKPKIRIIAYSHGGNVALNLAAVADKTRIPFFVDELILLGTPIQQSTEYLICSPLFKKTYLFFSKNDIVQCIDCFNQGRPSSFSKRCFCSSKLYNLPDTLTQIEIRIQKKYPITNKPRFKAAPKHIEFWFFNWLQGDGGWYRPYFYFNPLPLALFTPILVQMTNRYNNNNKNMKNPCKRIILTIDLAKEACVINEKNCSCKYRYPGISHALFESVKKIAWDYKKKNNLPA